MPEGPEIRHSRDVLRRYEGSLLANFRCGSKGRYSKVPPVGHEGLLVAAGRGESRLLIVSSHGKFMWWALDVAGESWFLMCTYGMSGWWTTAESKHTSYAVDLPGRGVLAFVDPRHFGTLKWTPHLGVITSKIASLGPDVLGEFELDAFAMSMSRKPKKTLAEALMDQSIVAGVGNYLKAEALYLAQLSPHRPVASLSSTEVQRLHSAIESVARLSYESGGATISTYRSVDGEEGRAQRRFCVYSHDRTPDGHEVVREKTLDGRTTWWCPSIQV